MSAAQLCNYEVNLGRVQLIRQFHRMKPPPRNNQQNHSQENENHTQIQNQTQTKKSFRQDHSRIHQNWYSKLQHALFKFSIGGITWVVYHICRLCVFGYFKYDATAQKLIISTRSRLVRRLAFLVKASIILFDYISLEIVLTYVAIFFIDVQIPSHASSSKHYHLMLLIVSITFSLWNNACLLLMAHSREYDARLRSVVNELHQLHCSICENFGDAASRCQPHIFILFLITLTLTGLQLYNYGTLELFCFFYHIVLFELWYCAYFAYQLLLLGWLSAFITFLEAYLARLQFQGAPTRRLAQQLLRFYKLYARLSQVHRSVSKLWLPVAGMLFSSVFMLSINGADALYNVIYDHETNQLSKWKSILQTRLGICLAPLVKMLLIGVCNDRFAQLEPLIRLQVFRIELWHSQMTSVAHFVQFVSFKHTCLGLQQHVHPIRNHIWHMGQTCSRHFVLVFIWCALVNTISHLQYTLTDGYRGIGLE